MIRADSAALKIVTATPRAPAASAAYPLFLPAFDETLTFDKTEN